MNARHRELFLGAAVPLLALTIACARPPDDNVQPGPFTGQVKPVLYVNDVEAAAPFYRDVLGFEFLGFSNGDNGPYYAEMAAASLKFGLHEPVEAGQQSRVGQARLYFRVTDLKAHRSHVIAAGARPGEVIETSWMDMFIVRDPDGNEIVFAVTDPARHSIDPW